MQVSIRHVRTRGNVEKHQSMNIIRMMERGKKKLNYHKFLHLQRQIIPRYKFYFDERTYETE